ncbi:MAG: hypothetical protein N3A64_02275 [Desulfobacterota bacterium]|nr:hypothetical protein [Thermodesulfobacteriota bacterium]
MEWEKDTQKKFELLISKLPLFHRGLAQVFASKKAEENAQARGANRVEEEDLIGAFFSEVPKPFYSMMVRLLEHTGFNYKKYGFPK